MANSRVNDTRYVASLSHCVKETPPRMAARCLDSSGATQLRSDPAAAPEEAKKGQQTDNGKDDDYECDHVVVISIRPELEPSPW